MAVESNPFYVKVPNALEALMAGEKGYKEVKGYQQDNALNDAGQHLRSGNYDAASEALFRAGKLEPALALIKLQREGKATDSFSQSIQAALGGSDLRQPASNDMSSASPPQSPLARLLTSPPASGTGDRLPVPSSAKVVGDDEGVKAGLYDPPTTPGAAPPVQMAQADAAPRVPGSVPASATNSVTNARNGAPSSTSAGPSFPQPPGTVNPQMIPALIKGLGDPNLPQGQRQVGLEILKTALQGAQMPGDLKEYVHARASNDPLAQVPYTEWLRGNKAAGATAITTDMRGENAEAAARGKSAGERASATMSAASAASRNLQTFARMDSMLDAVAQGKMEPGRMNISAWAKSLGLEDGVAEKLGLDPKSVGTAQALTALTNESVIGKIGAGGFPANNFSDADRGFLTDTVPKLGNDPRANKLMVEAGRRMARLDIQKSKDWVDYRRSNKGASYEDFEVSWNDKVAKQDMFGDLRQKAEQLLRSTQPAGVNAPRQSAAPTIQDIDAELRRRGGSR